jgi:hypothetical protein
MPFKKKSKVSVSGIPVSDAAKRGDRFEHVPNTVECGVNLPEGDKVTSAGFPDHKR